MTDNARNAINAMRNVDTHPINVEVTCAAHTLQLCVMDVLKREDVDKIFSAARKVVAHFKHSNIAATNLKLKQEQLGMKKLKLIQSCKTRWDSSYAMIKRLITNRSAVMNVLMDRSITNSTTAQTLEISEIEWLSMESLAMVLKLFQVATTVLCADKQAPTSMVRPGVFSLHNIHLSESADDIMIIADMQVSLRAGLSRRFELEMASSQMGCEFDLVSARQIASFFDPHYKDLLFESEAARDAIRSRILRHFADEIMDENENEIQETATDFLFSTAPKQTSGKSEF